MASVSSNGGTACHSGGCQQEEGRLLHVIAKSAAARHSRWHQKGGVSSCPKKELAQKGHGSDQVQFMNAVLIPAIMDEEGQGSLGGSETQALIPWH